MVTTNPVLSWIIWILFVILFFSFVFLMEKRARKRMREYEKKASKETKEMLMRVLTDKTKAFYFSDNSAEKVAKGIMKLTGYKEIK